MDIRSRDANAATGRPVAAAVLAGGLAARMGGNKAGATLAGVPLVVHATDALRQAGLEPFIVTRADRSAGIEGVTEVLEEEGPRHPLAGLAAAIRHADGRDVIVLACDLPLLPPAYFAWLATLPDGAAMPSPGGRPQPLAARYSSKNLKSIQAALERQMPVKSIIETVKPTMIGDSQLHRFGDPGRMFFNVNSPEDLRRAEEMLSPD